MLYKDIELAKTDKTVRTRIMRRLWSVKVFSSDPHTKKGKVKQTLPAIREETVIAHNATDAIQQLQFVAERPEFIGYVTYPRPGEDWVYLIDSPKDGPKTDEKIKPTVGGVGDTGDDWDF